MPKHKFTLKYDEFFKIVTKNFFELLNCNVITEYEILKLPKKADIIIIKNPNTKKFELFKYFKIYNIIFFRITFLQKALLRYFFSYCYMVEFLFFMNFPFL
ncbi:MAG: hypothetical protein KatS3mg129_2945 [Leptospiraceae bacterium]|nr:MAG: hypothetical protein KatS3mg129_2945 [Leptospiraceae bacterium]